MRHFGPADARDMPWKNGGGVTRELLKLPHPTDPARFLARLSIATVATSGPFSAFPGVDRTILVLEGRGMRLLLDGTREVVLDRPLQPFAFPGEAAVHCELLGGTVRDFNLMVERDAASASLEVVQLGAGQTLAVREAPMVLLHGVSGSARVGDMALGVEETLWAELPGEMAASSEHGAILLAIHLEPRR
jgi:uncharacterized protein